MRAVFAICGVCFAVAIYTGHHIISETHFPRSYEISRVPGVAKGPPRDSIASLEQAQRIRASQFAAAGIHSLFTFDTIADALGGR